MIKKVDWEKKRKHTNELFRVHNNQGTVSSPGKNCLVKIDIYFSEN